MTQQISIEDALTAFREQHGKLADENVLLRAQVARLERDLETARAQAIAEAPETAGPNLAAAPPYRPADDQG